VLESDTTTMLARGVQGLAIRVAKAVNRILKRKGRVFGDRYHSRLLKTPREVRNALVYVLQNVGKHLRNVVGLDPCSSAVWFGGWRTAIARPVGRAPVAEPRTWLARIGWRRHGLLDPRERPRRARLNTSRVPA
jgi:hypothetical protein